MIFSTEKVSDEFLCLNNCGIQALGNIDIRTHRPNGRVDYYIFYIYSGRCTIHENGTDTEAKSGDLILYRPNEPQNYSFSGKDKSISMYLHFTGTTCKTLLEKYKLSDKRIYHIGVSNTIKQIFQRMEYEYLLKKPFYQEHCCGMIMELFATIGRKHLAPHTSDTASDKRISDICKIMITDFSDWHNIQYYADLCNLSPSRFSHIFKKYVGTPPQEYLMRLRISKASDLLCETDLSVREVSEILGFGSEHYFIRVFKNHTGLSPLKFKKLPK